jgi:hypothetical protein
MNWYKKSSSEFYHVTLFGNVDSISKFGLRKNTTGRGMFGGSYGNWSKGKIFLAGSIESAERWWNKISEIQATADSLDQMICVLLKITSAKVFPDDLGNKDVQDSYYTTEDILPQNIEFWSPDTKDWEPISEWHQLVSGPESGVRESYTPDNEEEEIHYPYEWEQEGGFKPYTKRKL